jgi:hypothetical protein
MLLIRTLAYLFEGARYEKANFQHDIGWKYRSVAREGGVHPHRITGGHQHYRAADFSAAAGFSEGQVSGVANTVRFES